MKAQLALLAYFFPLIVFSQMKLVVIAHRGNHERAPENTLLAFEHAIAIGVDYVEVDLRTTKDGILVVLHDATIDRMTDSIGRVDEITWEELRKRKVNQNEPSLPLQRVPTFREVLNLCQGKTKIYLDFKQASVGNTWALVKEYKMDRDVVVYVNSHEQHRAWLQHAPDVPIIISPPAGSLSPATLHRFLADATIHVLDGRLNTYSPQLIESVHQEGVQVWLDVQQPQESIELWKSAISLGIDGLQTDHPQGLIIYLKQAGLR